MGIPYYVASLLRKHKQIQTDFTSLDVDILGIDFNCFIHKYLNASNPIGSIVTALSTFLDNTVRAKQVYLAFDGVVPYAKIVQQRYRRMRIQPEAAFDKHQISPETPYMKELAETIRILFPTIVVSGTDEPGEGEHKIFQWARTLPADQRRTIGIYGLDADLLLISVAQRQLGSIVLIREQENEGFSKLSIPGLVSVLPIEPDAFVRMSIFWFGNDFMPAVAMFSLREDGYARALYFMEKGTPHKQELDVLKKRAKESDRRIVAPDGHALETRIAVHLFDGVLNWEPVVHAFWKTYEWTYHYFTTSEVLDWCWFYPYPEAPLLQTLEDFPRETTFTWDHPTLTFTASDQLSFILPERSLNTANGTVRYPDELYEEETESRHPWMRRYAWECDPYISLPWNPASSLTTVTEVQLP